MVYMFFILSILVICNIQKPTLGNDMFCMCWNLASNEKCGVAESVLARTIINCPIETIKVIDEIDVVGMVEVEEW